MPVPMNAAMSLAAAAILTATAQQPVTVNVPGTPANAPTTITGCLMPGGGTTNMPGSGGSSSTGPAGMNADAANTGVFFVVNLGRKPKPAETKYALVGANPDELKRYANSRVEVTGSLEPSPLTTAQGSGKNVTLTSAKKGEAKSPSRFRVTALKQVPGGCGGQ